MRRSIGLWALAFVLAVSISFGTASATFEHELVKADFVARGPLAQAALAQYPDAAPRVFAIYGQTPEFNEVLHRYGYNQIIPIVDKCLRDGDDFLAAGNDVQQFAGALLHFQRPDPKPLTPIQCGATAIDATLISGNDFLGEFTIDGQGEARRLPGSTIFAGVKQATLGGLESLERKIVDGDDVNVGDWGNAALDVVVVGAAGKSVAKLIELRVAADAGRPTLAAELDAARGGTLDFARAYAPTLAKYATLGGAVYLVVQHPALISGAAATLAQIFGLPPFLVQVLVWMLILALPLRLLAGLFGGAMLVARLFGHLCKGAGILSARSVAALRRPRRHGDATAAAAADLECNSDELSCVVGRKGSPEYRLQRRRPGAPGRERLRSSRSNARGASRDASVSEFAMVMQVHQQAQETPGATLARWIDLKRPDQREIDQACHISGLRVPSRAELEEIETSSRTHLEAGALYISLPMLVDEKADRAVATPVGFILTGETLVTIRFDELPAFDSVQAAVEGTTTPSEILVRLIEAIIDHLADVDERVEDDLTKLSTRIFAPQTSEKQPNRASSNMRAILVRLGHLGNVISLVRGCLLGLTRMNPFVLAHASSWLTRDQSERLDVAKQDTASLIEFEVHLSDKTQFLLDATLGFVNIAQNDLFRILTIASVVGIPPTILVGIWGMNFHSMPELTWTFGYPLALAAIILSAAIPAVWFKLRGWL